MKSVQVCSLYILFICLLTAGSAKAQYSSIIDRLKADVPGEGKVTITADEKILALTGKCMAGDDTCLKLNGFRINVFSGNNRDAKETALSRERMIKEKFPEVSTYVIYNSPVFRLRVGDFQHTEEATAFLFQLKKEFPQFAREMFVVSDEIKISIVN